MDMEKALVELTVLQRETLLQLWNVLPHAHMVNVVVRLNGGDRVFQADWL